MSDSLWRITSDIVGQMIKEWLFGTAKTTAALATEGVQVGILTQLYLALAAAKAAAGAGSWGGGGASGAGTSMPRGGGGGGYGFDDGGYLGEDVAGIGKSSGKSYEFHRDEIFMPISKVHRASSKSEVKNLTMYNSITIGQADERTASLLLLEIEDRVRSVLREEMR